jgi:hypothetical protein
MRTLRRDGNSKVRYVVDNQEVSIAIKHSFGKVKETDFKRKKH